MKINIKICFAAVENSNLKEKVYILPKKRKNEWRNVLFFVDFIKSNGKRLTEGIKKHITLKRKEHEALLDLTTEKEQYLTECR